jgi:hypothetical protein
MTRELHRRGRLAGIHFVPSDPRVEERAWDAALVDRGPFARAVDHLARLLTDAWPVVRAPGAGVERPVDVA